MQNLSLREIFVSDGILKVHSMWKFLSFYHMILWNMFMLIYPILFAKVKQQNLTDNNLLNLIKFGQVNEKLLH